MATLRKGDEGAEVKNLQMVLDALGFGLDPDGQFGNKTHHAVVAAQKSLGLKPDGIVGDLTRAGLEKAYQPGVENFSSSGVVSDGALKEVAAVKNTSAVKDHKRLAGVHPVVAQKAVELIEIAEQNGVKLRVTSGVRTFAEQQKLFRKRPRITRAPAGRSVHNYGLAFDVAIILPNGKADWSASSFDRLGPWAKQVGGLEWGGDWRSFKDRPHFQLAGLPSTKKMLAVYKAGGSGKRGMAAVWKRYAS